MIELRLPLDTDASEPFVTKLGGPNVAGGAGIARLVGDFDDSAVFDRQGEIFTVTGARAAELEGDVVLVDPQAGALFRWLRRGSPHNTLLVTERCDQLCLMCSQPPRKTHVDLFAYFRDACLMADVGAVIGLSGGEPTLYKVQLFNLIEEILAARPDLSFHVLTNAQHFEPTDISWLRRWPHQLRWGVPLYSADADQHDAIVAKPGAFDRLQASLAVLLQAGAAVELRTVVVRPNAAELPQLARLVAARLPFIDVWAIMQLENIGFARNRWAELYYEHADGFEPIAAAIDTALLSGVPVALYNFPRCSVPPAYRDFAHASISDWKRKYLPACGECSERSSCSGFFEWHPESTGNRGIRPL